MNKSKKTISALGSYAGYKSGIIKNPLTLVESGPCQFWFDGKDNSKLSLNGNKVIRWYDKSGFDRHVSNDVDEKRPTYDPATGRVTFNTAAETYLQSAAFGSPLSQPNTIFIIYKIIGATDIFDIVFDAVIGSQRFYFQGSFFRGLAGVGFIGGATNNNDNIHCIQFNGAVSNYWINNVLAGGPGDIGNNSLNGIILGAGTGLVQFCNVEICEVFGYNCSITEAERIKCENYLYKKYGLSY